MKEKGKSCCSNPPEVQMDEKARRSIRNFIIGFILVLILGGILIYIFREAPVIRHLYMSPQQMQEHFKAPEKHIK